MMTREQILTLMLDKVEDSIWLLATLKQVGKPINKEKMAMLTNERYMQAKGQQLIKSRYVLDKLAARLEGAALTEVERCGQSRLYSLSELGIELIQFRSEQTTKRSEGK